VSRADEAEKKGRRRSRRMAGEIEGRRSKSDNYQKTGRRLKKDQCRVLESPKKTHLERSV
jgi:hypothetical protein